MRIGLPLDVSKPVPDAVDQARQIASGRFDAAVAMQIFGPDALTLLAVVGSHVPDIELVTEVVPTWPRHPVVLASQALTVQQATGGRLTLGIGLSHQVVVEGVFGIPFQHPLRHMRDYLAILLPLLRGEQVTHEGASVRASTFGPLEISGPTPSVIVAALGPKMLDLAGRQADGTTTWMTGPSTLASHIIPSITRAAADAGRPAPRILAGFPVAVTADADAARERMARVFSIYGTLPSYQAMLEREGVSGPADVAIVGDEEAVAAQVRHLAEIGVTDFHAVPVGPPDEAQATVGLLTALRSELAGGTTA